MRFLSMAAALALSGCALRKDGDDSGVKVTNGMALSSDKFRAVVELDNGCTGTFVNATTLLTAAHCLPSAGSPSGGISINGTSAQRYFVHPSKALGRYDMMVVVFPASLTQSLGISTFHDVASSRVVGQDIRLVGYGCNAEAENGSCTGGGVKRYGENRIGTIGDGLVSFESLASGPGTGQNAGNSKGDSGGPIFDTSNRITAIVSYGNVTNGVNHNHSTDALSPESRAVYKAAIQCPSAPCAANFAGSGLAGNTPSPANPPANPPLDGPQGPANSIGAVGATPFSMAAMTSGFYTREGTEVHRYQGGTWSEIGYMDALPAKFEMVAGATTLYTREDDEIHMYKNANWSKIGTVGPLAFGMATVGDRLIVRKGEDILAYDNGSWSDIGAVGAEPFVMVGDATTLYTREGNELHKYKNGTWSKIHGGLSAGAFSMVAASGGLFTREGSDIFFHGASRAEIGGVGAEPFVMVGSSGGLVTREGAEIHSYAGGQWRLLKPISPSAAFDMTADVQAVYYRQGADILRSPIVP